ncbi:FAD-linked oxidase C-terminal domain-containing protein [Ramlibacter sp. 2FC]|uniref:FAD-linked oxidase C-terminal domain-containing protein n=1 Tax=Ramlibacter sp. 2FC TaxID=2502188 RepID=UPI0010F9B166|nr:FAD-linked oxidase C-terminal domain-containing protein [Ramlibacter sp. 2FC]
MTTHAWGRKGAYRKSSGLDGFLESLRTIVGPSWVLSGDEEVAPFECDALFHLRQRPRAVVLPGNESEVLAVLRFCAEARIAIVPRGAGTSLSGGAMPVAEGIVMSLNRMKRLVIDAAARQAVAGPGVRNVVVSQQAAPHGLFFAPDPSSQAASTIGGNIAENAGGVHCVKYGLTVNNVVGARVVTGAGELLELGGGSLDQAGLDLLSLMNGSEGLLGLVTEARLRLLPAPKAVRVLLAFFSSVQATCEAVTRIIAAGIMPAGLEVMDQASLQTADGYSPALALRIDAGGALLCELDGELIDIADATCRVSSIFETLGALEVRHADDEAQRYQLWAARKNVLPALLRTARDVYVADCVVPRHALSQVLDKVMHLGRERRIDVVQAFHAGDGNLHSVLRYDSDIPGEEDRAMALADAIMQTALAAGGTVSGEHGIGTEKLHGMCWQFSADELDVFHGIRAVFDPHGILNPGKSIPTLHRCAEFGGMHIRRGELPHADLPRF